MGEAAEVERRRLISTFLHRACSKIEPERCERANYRKTITMSVLYVTRPDWRGAVKSLFLHLYHNKTCEQNTQGLGNKGLITAAKHQRPPGLWVEHVGTMDRCLNPLLCSNESMLLQYLPALCFELMRLISGNSSSVIVVSTRPNKRSNNKYFKGIRIVVRQGGAEVLTAKSWSSMLNYLSTSSDNLSFNVVCV